MRDWIQGERCKVFWLYLIFFIPLGFYFVVDAVRVAQLQIQPSTSGIVKRVQPWRNWLGWEFKEVYIMLDDKREAAGSAHRETIVTPDTRVQFHWSGRPGDRIYIHDPNIVPSWLLGLFLWVAPAVLLRIFPYFEKALDGIEAWEQTAYRRPK